MIQNKNSSAKESILTIRRINKGLSEDEDDQ